MLNRCKLLVPTFSSLFLVGCSGSWNPLASSSPSPSPSPILEASAVSTPSPIPSPSMPSNIFEMGLEKASKAAYSAKNAEMKEDWELTANRWQQAIEMMESLPIDHPNSTEAQANIPEYKRNLLVAQNRSQRTVSGAGYLQVDAPGKVDSVNKVVSASAKGFLEGYMNSIVNQGRTGHDFWCSKSKGSRVSFFSPRSWDLLDSHTSGSRQAAAFTVQLDSSNKGGSQITTNWAVVIEREQRNAKSKISPGNWCVSMILEK